MSSADPPAGGDAGAAPPRHSLAMDVEAMRRAGYATVDALVARLADPEADPVPPASASERKSLDELVHQGHW